MRGFELYDAGTVKEAVDLLSKHSGRVVKVVGGGSDIVGGVMKDWVQGKGMPLPEVLIDITTIKDIVGIRSDGGGTTIGAATTLSDIIDNKDLGTKLPILTSAALSVASPLIRNFGTLGGNINQRPRCWYFRNEEFVCLKKGGNRCFAPAGENQFHAIFGNGPSHIVHASSLAVPSVAYGAKFRLVGPSGERLVESRDYFTMPTMQNVRTENVLAPDEVLTHVILPPPGNVKTGHYEVRYKASHDWPIAFATVVLGMDGATIKSARVVMGAVAPVPWRAQAAEQALVGKRLDEATAAAAAEAALEGARPMSRNGYKVQVAKTAVKRAILQAAGIKTA